MSTVRKSVMEFQPSDEVLQQIVLSLQSDSHDTVRTLLTQSLRPRVKKEKLKSPVQLNRHERLVLLYMYVCMTCAKGDADADDDSGQYQYGMEEEDAPFAIPSDWKAAATVGASIPNEIYRLLCAYKYYRQQNYSKVVHLYLQQREIFPGEAALLAAGSKKIQLAWENLYAQSLHHLQNGTAALQVYQGILLRLDQTSSSSSSSISFRPDHIVQLYTNYVALLLSYFTIPYCRTTTGTGSTANHHGSNEIMTQIQQSVVAQLSKHQRQAEVSNAMISSLYIDLSYNVATYYLLSTASTARERQEWLQVLFTYYDLTSNQHFDFQQRFKDRFSFRLNYKIFREYYWNMSSSIMKNKSRVLYSGANELLFPDVNETDGKAQLSAQQQCVYRMNDVMLSLQQSASPYGSSQPSSSPEQILQSIISEYVAATGDNRNSCLVLTNIQLHIIHYNIAIYQYYCQQYTNCQQTCQLYFLSTSSNNKSNKKKKKHTAGGGETLHVVDCNTVEIKAPAQYQTPDEKCFWECRATVLLAHCVLSAVLSPTTTSAANTTTDDITGCSDDTAPLNDEITKVLSSAVEMLDPFCVLPPPNHHSFGINNHVVLYARLHQYALRSKLSNQNGSANVSLQFLESLPETIRTKPVLQSMIRKQQKYVAEQPKLDSELKHSPIDDTPTLSKLQDLLQAVETSKSNPPTIAKDWKRFVVFADFAISRKRYADATALYEVVVNAGKPVDLWNDDDYNSVYTTMMTNYVRALSFVRPKDAITVWSAISNRDNISVPDLIPADNDSLTSGSELEMKEIIFHHSLNNIGAQQQRKAAATDHDVSDDTTTKKKKSREAVLRRRAKKREVYLEQHQKANGSAGMMLQQQPDPERWLPKFERSSYAKYRRNNKKGAGGIQQPSQSKSSQGIVSVQDMAKLDVVAHQAATAAAIATAAADGTTDASTIAALRSTAHMNVSNKGRGKKRR